MPANYYRKSVSFLVVYSYLFVLIINIIFPTTKNFLPKSSINQFLTIIDEVFIVGLFFFTLIKKRKSYDLLALLFFYFLVGATSGIINKTPVFIIFFGYFLSVKGILLAYSLIHWKFTIKEINFFFKNFKGILFFVVFFFVIDFIFGESFKNILKLKYESRAGFVVSNSFFRHPADLAYFSFFWFYYYTSFYKNNILTYLTFLMGLLTFRVKDIMAAVLTHFIGFKGTTGKMFKKIIIILPISFFLLLGYIHFLPTHFKNYFGDSESDPVARTVLYFTAGQIANENFPLGEGFGRYAGEISTKYYSPVYKKYGIDSIFGLNPERDGVNFATDTFWPMIIGESGVVGLLIYLLIIYKIVKPIMRYRAKGIVIDTYVSFARKLLFSTFIISFAIPAFSAPPTYLIFFGVIGLISSMINGYIPEKY